MGAMIIAAADGSSLSNPGPAGWAWYVDDARWAAGGWAHGTKNRGRPRAGRGRAKTAANQGRAPTGQGHAMNDACNRHQLGHAPARQSHGGIPVDPAGIEIIRALSRS